MVLPEFFFNSNIEKIMKATMATSIIDRRYGGAKKKTILTFLKTNRSDL
jgi:hypothetical protein